MDGSSGMLWCFRLRPGNCVLCSDDDGPVSIVCNSKTVQELAKIGITIIEGF
jgi:hypothetical protein